jgi:hypothetical protein
MQDTTESSAPVVAATEPDVGQLARELAELRAEHRTELEALRAARVADRAELEAVRAEVKGHHIHPRPDAVLGQREELSKRWFARRPNGSGDQREPSGLVSRRRLFGLLGGAAATGAGLAVAGSTLGADPAAAQTVVGPGNTDGDALAIGDSNSCTSATGLTSAAVEALSVVAQGVNGIGVNGECHNGAGAAGVVGYSQTGYGLYGTAVAGLAPLRLQPNSSAGAPTTGTHQLGELYVDTAGKLFLCVAVGTPGTWVKLSSPFVTVTPVRIYDSRPGQPPTGVGPKTPINNGVTRSITVTPLSGVPATASAVLGNVTVVNGVNPGVFLTIFAEGGSANLTSSVNAGSGGIVANNFTSQLGTSTGISVTCGGGPTDYILDILGYYA